MKGKNNVRLARKTVIVFVMAFMLTVFGAGNLFADHWASKEMNDWKEKGLLSGDASGNFRENDAITRAEFMALINRMEGFTDKSDAVDAFEDVDSNDWYYEVVSIALKAGYINGTSEKTISPNSKITREEAMAILSRLSKAEKNSESYKKASDHQQVSDWAKEAVSTCIANGFIAGDKGKIKPLFNITRAEAIVMLDRKLTDTRTFAFEGNYDLKNIKVKNIEVLTKGVNLKNLQVSGNVTIGEQVDGKIDLEGTVETLVNKGMNTEIEFHGAIKTLEMKADARLLGDVKVEKLNFENEAKLILQDQKGNTKEITKNTEKIDLTNSKAKDKKDDKKDLKKQEKKKDKNDKQGPSAPSASGASGGSSGSSGGSSGSGSSGSSSGSGSSNSGTAPSPSKPQVPKAEVLTFKLEKKSEGVKLVDLTPLTKGNKYVLVKNAKEEVLASAVEKNSELQGETVENLETALKDLKAGSWVLLYEVRVEDGKNKVQKLGSAKVTGDLIGAQKVMQIESSEITAKRGTSVNGTILSLPAIAPENKYVFKKNLSEDEANLEKIYEHELVSNAKDHVAEENIPGIQPSTYILVYEVNKDNEIQKAGRIHITQQMLGEAAEKLTEIVLQKGIEAYSVKIQQVSEEKASENKYIVSVEENDVKAEEIVKHSTLPSENRQYEDVKLSNTNILDLKAGQYIVLYEVDKDYKIIRVGSVKINENDMDIDAAKLPMPKVEKGSKSGHTKITFSNFSIAHGNTVVYEVKGDEGGHPEGYPIDDSMSEDKYTPFENGKEIMIPKAELWLTIYERNKENELVRYISIQIHQDQIQE